MFDDDWKKNNTDKINPTVCNAQINNTKPKIFRRNRLDRRKEGAAISSGEDICKLTCVILEI